MQSLLLWQFTYLLKPAFSSQLWIVFLIFSSSQRALYLLTTENTGMGAKSHCSSAQFLFLFFPPLFQMSAADIRRRTFIITVYWETTVHLTNGNICCPVVDQTLNFKKKKSQMSAVRAVESCLNQTGLNLQSTWNCLRMFIDPLSCCFYTVAVRLKQPWYAMTATRMPGT